MSDKHLIQGASPYARNISVTIPQIHVPEWMTDAPCTQVDPDLFFPNLENKQSTTLARRVCGGCDVREQCLAYALKNRIPAGVWGGAITVERRRMRAA